MGEKGNDDDNPLAADDSAALQSAHGEQAARGAQERTVDVSRGSFDDGHQRQRLLPAHPAGASQASEATFDRQFQDGDDGHDPAVDRITAVVLAKIESHLHLPIQPPDPDALARLKTADPDAYAMWLRVVEKRIDHDMAMEKATTLGPGQLVRRGQWFGLITVVLFTALAVLAIALDHPWVASMVVVFDVVAIVGLFTNVTNTEPPTDPPKHRKEL